MKPAEYVSGFDVAKRPTIYIDAKDPRVRNAIEAKITAARLGAEIVIVDDPTLSPAGKFSSLRAGGVTGSLAAPKGFNPTSSSFIKPADISNLAASWNDSTLVITFNFNFSNAKNKYVDKFEYQLSTPSATSQLLEETSINKTSASQVINFTYSKQIDAFNIFSGTYTSIKVRAKDSFGNVGDFAELLVIPEYEPDLCTPEIVANSIPRGYSVSFVEVCSKPFEFVSIEEIVSSANTAPSAGYEQIYLSNIRPATVITPTTESRWVRARYTDGTGSYGSYSDAVKVTPESLISADTTGPDNVANVVVSSGIDTSGYLGFNAYADISWPAVTGGGIRGYRIRFSNDNGTTYSYVDSPGTGTTYRLGGLAIGSTYKIAVATYDEFNNLSSSFVSGPDVTVTGTPSVSNVIAAGPFQFGVGVGGVSTNKGLYFDSSNYWYINAANSARLKVGGTTSNYLEWDGATFAIDGNITARQGTFAGNVSIITGGSLIAGTVGSSSVIVNSDGLSANNSNGAALTEIITSPITFGNTPKNNSTGATQQDPLPFPINFFTQGAMIGGWVVGNTVITDRSQQFTLDSSNKRISITGTTPVGEGNTNFTVRFGTALTNTNPLTTTGTTNIFEAGTTGQKPKFYITQRGDLNAVDANLQGKLTTAVSGNAMEFGATVGDSGEDGIHINSTNYWYSTAQFSLGGGRLTGTHDTLTIDLGAGLSASTTKFFLNNLPATDDDGWAGDPTITIRDDNRIVRGRRFIFNSNISGNTPPTNPSSGGTTDNGNNNWFDPTTRVGEYLVGTTQRPVKAGDILMIQE